MEPVWLAIVVGFFGFLTASMPVLLAWQASKAHAAEKRADNKRQDEVEARQLAVKRQVEEAARLLVVNNAKVETAAAETKGQLFAIHTLVNSDKTEALQARLDQTKISLTLMNEIVRLNRAKGDEPTQEARASIEATKVTIADLENQLRDRLVATKTVEQYTPGG
jgi:hypothetical protein